MTVSALALGLFWSMKPLVSAILYWRALILIENGQLEIRSVIM